jgi:hypothetical protein
MSQDQQQQLLLPLPLPPPLNNNYPNQEHPEQQQPLSFSGRWIPLPKILYGTTIYPFNPIQIDPRKVDIKGKGKQPTEEEPNQPPNDNSIPNLVPANPNQVSLRLPPETSLQTSTYMFFFLTLADHLISTY